MSERTDVKVLGRIIGSATGWDEDPGGLSFYDFIPTPPFDRSLEACSMLTVSILEGTVACQADDGTDVCPKKDIIDVLWFNQGEL